MRNRPIDLAAAIAVAIVGRLRPLQILAAIALAAIIASPDRTAGLRSVAVPTLVIHGEADPLVDVSGGRATAAAVPGAELIVLPGMGHDLPRALWPRVLDAIAANALSR